MKIERAGVASRRPGATPGTSGPAFELRVRGWVHFWLFAQHICSGGKDSTRKCAKLFKIMVVVWTGGAPPDSRPTRGVDAHRIILVESSGICAVSSAVRTVD